MPTITTESIIDSIAAEFVYWGGIPELARIASFDELLRRYEGHYYDVATRRFFGTRNPHLAAPGVTVECQSKAPDGVGPYLVTAWVRDPDTGRISPKAMGRRSSLGGARRHARRLAEAWPA